MHQLVFQDLHSLIPLKNVDKMLIQRYSYFPEEESCCITKFLVICNEFYNRTNFRATIKCQKHVLDSSRPLSLEHKRVESIAFSLSSLLNKIYVEKGLTLEIGHIPKDFQTA